jgi:hypothetical protein
VVKRAIVVFAVLGLAPMAIAAPATTSTASRPTSASAEVFLLPVRVDDQTLLPLARSLERRLGQRLSAAGHRTMTSQDLGTLLDVAAARQNAGCDDDDACIAELAGSVGAEQVVAAALSRFDDTYRLDLTLTDRQAARVLGRGRATGPTAEALENDLDNAIAVLFGDTRPASNGPSPLLVGGAVGVGVGLLVASVGGALGARALLARGALDEAGVAFDDAPSAAGVRALRDAHVADEAARQTWNTLGLPLAAVGGVVVGAGAVVAILGAASGE